MTKNKRSKIIFAVIFANLILGTTTVNLLHTRHVAKQLDKKIENSEENIKNLIKEREQQILTMIENGYTSKETIEILLNDLNEKKSTPNETKEVDEPKETHTSTHTPYYFSADNSFYTVKKGDTLSEILYNQYGDYYLSGIKAIALINSLDNVNELEIGQTLEIPSIETVKKMKESGELDNIHVANWIKPQTEKDSETKTETVSETKTETVSETKTETTTVVNNQNQEKEEVKSETIEEKTEAKEEVIEEKTEVKEENKVQTVSSEKETTSEIITENPIMQDENTDDELPQIEETIPEIITENPIMQDENIDDELPQIEETIPEITEEELEVINEEPETIVEPQIIDIEPKSEISETTLPEIEEPETIVEPQIIDVEPESEISETTLPEIEEPIVTDLPVESTGDIFTPKLFDNLNLDIDINSNEEEENEIPEPEYFESPYNSDNFESSMFQNEFFNSLDYHLNNENSIDPEIESETNDDEEIKSFTDEELEEYEYKYFDETPNKDDESIKEESNENNVPSETPSHEQKNIDLGIKEAIVALFTKSR